MGCLPCKMAKSRHNKLSKNTEINESQMNPLSSSLLGQSQVYDGYGKAEIDELRNDKNVQYAAPQPSLKAQSSASSEAADESMNSTSYASNSASAVKKDEVKGFVVPTSMGPVTRAVKGRTVLTFEHPFKQQAFKKRGQLVKSWKRRHFVMDGGDLMYFKDCTLAEKNGELPLCGAIVNYIDESGTTGCAAIEVHSGKRVLLMECDSSFLAEEWTTALYDVIIIQDIAYLRNHFPASPTAASEYKSIRELRRFQKFSTIAFSNDVVLTMCSMIRLHYESALAVLQKGVECILFGVDVSGRTNVQTGLIKLADDQKGLLWSSVSVSKKVYTRKGSIDSGAERRDGESDVANDISNMYFKIPFDSITDIVIGSLTADSGSGSVSLSTGSVISIVTAVHSLEFELDTSEISTWSCYIANETLNKINANISVDSTDSRMTTAASVFSRPSSMFSFGADGSTGGKSQQELAVCPQIVTRHPFYKALRMLLLIHGHIQMVRYVETFIRNNGLALSTKLITVPNVQASVGIKKLFAGMRPVERAREKAIV